MKKKLKVIELFAGVGGFRIGLEKTGKYEVVWSNQWEPSTKTQHANMVYQHVFGSDTHSGDDIHLVKTDDIDFGDLLVGGFPCQDYSVATTLKNSKGIEGKKGVLWWQINRILDEMKKKPKYLILENVDRIIKSPSTQRGRDFAIILKCLQNLGYAAEWRVINAADYGFPQRRRRLFLVGYHKSTKQYKKILKDKKNWISKSGVLAKSCPIGNVLNYDTLDISNDDILTISDTFNLGEKISLFKNTGCMIEGKVITTKTISNYDGEYVLLGDIIEKGKVDDEFYINKDDLDKWQYLKGSKKEVRVSSSGFKYNYSEGSMIFPDDLDKASRTIITGEGGKSPSRFKHVISTSHGLRRLTPVELERLNGFTDNHTKLEGISNAKRAFFMGNALVCGVVELIGQELAK
tara:strand:+ start:186 stop:1400 length:1215 start_codon:yes stop_codon:yes gene_type:complete